MTTRRIHGRAAMFACATGLVLHMSPAIAGDQHQNSRHRHNRPVDVTFTKWVTTGTFLAGIAGGDVDGRFVGEVLEGQTSVNPEMNPNPEGLAGTDPERRTAPRGSFMQVNADDEDASFTALIRGGQNQVTGVARFTGFVVAGWRSWGRGPGCVPAVSRLAILTVLTRAPRSPRPVSRALFTSDPSRGIDRPATPGPCGCRVAIGQPGGRGCGRRVEKTDSRHQPALSSRSSQTLASRQSRRTVPTETCNASAVSSALRPPKNRISTT